MKKFIALLTASLLFASMTVSAEESVTDGAIDAPIPLYASEGFNSSSDQQAAEERGMKAGEYYNNVVMSTPGVINAIPVGQGGRILVNGAPSNLTATLSKVTMAVSGAANAQAAMLGGTLLNVVKVDFPGANYNVATINFYLKGLAGNARVAAKQLLDGEWEDVEVVEARTDHVILNLKKGGIVAFVSVP